MDERKGYAIQTTDVSTRKCNKKIKNKKLSEINSNVHNVLKCITLLYFLRKI